MKVYHGSTQAVEYPLVGVGRENLDFGKGFSINVSLTSVSLLHDGIHGRERIAQ